jgi:hypothetical protein
MTGEALIVIPSRDFLALTREKATTLVGLRHAPDEKLAASKIEAHSAHQIAAPSDRDDSSADLFAALLNEGLLCALRFNASP